MSTQAEPSIYALLTDGTTVEIRAAWPEDFAAVRNMHAKMSPDNLYLPFTVDGLIWAASMVGPYWI